ncbi:hypothetical protein ACFPAF_06440 [Hymenobacter endophyticus]|uniref:Uncharacterized protein n=1 Tax=Hymenobacter endophyticus TaxID=3076335 RepID=A0ABU3TF88_9BACT|nr:hypothetical protein [Hymenobacter endophyticus]MDU0370023.1 hypothetical protein [Hymenobacter endophyticus]
MDTAANLAFFQTFYTGAALYVLPEAAAPEVAPAAEPIKAALEQQRASTPAPETPAPRPAVEPVTAAPVPPTPTTVPVQPAPSVAPPLPAPAAPAHVPAPLVAAPPLVTPASAPSAQALGTLPLAPLPAAAAAPAGRVQPTPTQSPVAHIPFSTLGSNPHGLVLLVRVSPEQFRKLPRNVFLNNLLKALRLVMEDVVLVNVEHEKYPVALCSLRRELAARQILAFGKNLLDVAVYTTQPYEPVLLYGDTAFLGAGEIDMLEYDAGRKKQLWQAVQRMFLS